MADLTARERFETDISNGENGIRKWNKWIDELVEQLEARDEETGLVSAYPETIAAEMEAMGCQTSADWFENLERKDGGGLNLAGVHMPYAKLVRADLWKADFTGANMRHADLAGADLKYANLTDAILEEADLTGASLSYADLERAQLGRAELRLAELDNATLTDANLQHAILTGAKMGKATLTRAKLQNADLKDADLEFVSSTEANFTDAEMIRASLREAKLGKALFIRTKLQRAKFLNANLAEAELRGAYLQNAQLVYANLRGAKLHDAKLQGAELMRADLTQAKLIDANLTGADLTRAVLVKANFTGAILNEAKLYGASVWDVELKDCEQKSMVVTPPNQPAFSVDYLEVAQFMYTILDNEKIRLVLDSSSTKGVLILGRFTHLEFLQGLKERLRNNGYLPMLFDFQKPDRKTLIDTVETMAKLCRFIIGDFTDPKIILQEFPAVLKTAKVPFLPIIHRDHYDENVKTSQKWSAGIRGYDPGLPSALGDYPEYKNLVRAVIYDDREEFLDDLIRLIEEFVLPVEEALQLGPLQVQEKIDGKRVRLEINNEKPPLEIRWTNFNTNETQLGETERVLVPGDYLVNVKDSRTRAKWETVNFTIQ